MLYNSHVIAYYEYRCKLENFLSHRAYWRWHSTNNGGA